MRCQRWNFVGFYLQSYSRKAFDKIDVDGNGYISTSELYGAVVLLYIYASQSLPTEITPPSVKAIDGILKAVDRNGDGRLDRTEFDDVCNLLAINIAMKSLIQVLSQIFLLPMLAMTLMDCFKINNTVQYRKYGIFAVVFLLKSLLLTRILDWIDYACSGFKETKPKIKRVVSLPVDMLLSPRKFSKIQ